MTSVLSNVAIEFNAWINDSDLEKLLREKFIISVREVDEYDVLSTPQAGDIKGKKNKGILKYSVNDEILPTGEIKSWAFARIGAPQSTSSTPMYFIDGQFEEQLSGASGPYTNVYNTYLAPVEPLSMNAYVPILPYYGGGSYHSTGVLSLVGAKQNGQLAVGMNPGQSMRLYGIGGTSIFVNDDPTTYMSKALDKAFADAESRTEYATLNISMNHYNGPSMFGNAFNFSSLAALGYYGKKFRAASNRFFITQAAGNKDQGYNGNYNACAYAYHRDQAYAGNDAIMVIGGYGYDGNHSNYTSMVGSCVEAWAPGLEISMSHVGTYGNEVWTADGTSFSAPLTAALATRYEGRPLQKDRYISRTLSSVRDVKHLSIGTYNNGYKFYPLTYTVTGASANYGSTTYINDQKFSQSSPAWGPGSGNGWVSVGWGAKKVIDGIRLSLRTSDPGIEPAVAQNGQCATNGQIPFGSCYPGDLHISVFAKVNGTWSLERHHVETKQTNGAPIYIPLPGYTNVDEILVWGDNQTSWFSIAELEVYANN